MARDAGALDRERRQKLGGPLGAGAGDGLGADEPRPFDAAPAETGFDRVALGGQVVAVQVEADLEPQRVAGPSPQGTTPASSSSTQIAGTIPGSISSSTPSSPV